jgi:signal peptidase I
MDDFYRQIALELSGASLPEQGMLRLKVTSQSMSPVLRSGDYIFVKSIPLEAIHRGDLLVTRREDGFLTHRLVARDSRGWLTKGDQNNQADFPVGAHEIIGLVVAFERLGKLHSLRTHARIIVARWLGWLGGQETGSRTQICRVTTRTLSLALRLLFR